jgi:ubiquinone/menaquinone biosynthesis C-methylase UbiE
VPVSEVWIRLRHRLAIEVAMRRFHPPYPEPAPAIYSYLMEGSKVSIPIRVLRGFLRFFFNHLYTTLAWVYDLVAWSTSVGQWHSWQKTGIEILPPGRVLELGHGTGHILHALINEGVAVVGIDPSAQMTHITSRRLEKTHSPACIARAKAQDLPFPAESFASVLCTFPSEYIFDKGTFSEAWRVLEGDGVFVIILGIKRIIGWKHGRRDPLSFLDELASLVYRLTGEAIETGSDWEEDLKKMLKALNFSVDIELVYLERAEVLRIVARKLPKCNS